MKKIKTTDLIASLIVAAVLLAFSMATSGLFKSENAKEAMRHLCDAFTAPGVVLVCVGALSWASSKGAYDIFGYGVKMLWGMLPFTSVNMDNVSYYDYAREKAEKRSGWRIDMLLVGTVCLTIALVFLIIYSVI